MKTRLLTVAMAAATLLPSLAHAQELSPTRQLRRAYLALTLQEPDVGRYEALLASGDPEAFIAAEVDALMSSPEFTAQLIDWGHVYMPFPEYPKGNPVWRSSNATHSDVCAEGTMHAGAVGIFGHRGDPEDICNDVNAPMTQTQPWWDPMRTVDVIGVAGNTDPLYMGEDCGQATIGLNWVKPEVDGCGCGPNLIYCHRQYPEDRFGTGYASTTRLDGNNYRANSQRRSAHDEPARLLAHIVRNDRPFSDLILSNYTVVDRGLYHMYVRQGRQSGVHPERDQELTWFTAFDGDDDWREVTFETMHPHILDEDTYTFVPSADPESEPRGIPAAGVLSMLGPNAAWPRPRVRAARWLESLACDEFTPPEVPIEFTPFQRDPATEGVCLHCHVRLDRAAVSFKRQYNGGYIAGIGEWRLDRLVDYSAERKRFDNTMIHDTVMTPVSESLIDQNMNARVVDYLDPSETLLGQTSDGTIGPRGFAKVLIASGRFDQCAVQRAYTRFGGRTLDVGLDAAELDAAVAAFVDGGRDMKALIRSIVLSAEARVGF